MTLKISTTVSNATFKSTISMTSPDTCFIYGELLKLPEKCSLYSQKVNYVGFNTISHFLPSNLLAFPLKTIATKILKLPSFISSLSSFFWGMQPTSIDAN